MFVGEPAAKELGCLGIRNLPVIAARDDVVKPSFHFCSWFPAITQGFFGRHASIAELHGLT